MTFILKRTLFLLSAVHLPLLLVCLGLAPNTLINRGLIDGQDVLIQTITLDNLGSGRIFGDNIAIGATTINNRKEAGSNAAPVIAARDRLDIGATTINNFEDGLLFSLGDLAIGGSLDGSNRATGQATTLNNNGATANKTIVTY